MSSTSVDLAIAVAAARDVRYHSSMFSWHSVSRDPNSTPVSSLTLLVWHSFVTLDDEVQYIWTHVTSLVVIQVRFLTPRCRLLQYA